MPTYEYRCKSCDHGFEIVQSFSDDALTTCPECEGPLRKVFGNVGIAFKGSGFYKTDSRSSSGSGSSSSSGSSGSSGSSSEGSSTGDSSGSSDKGSSDKASSDASSSSSGSASGEKASTSS